MSFIHKQIFIEYILCARHYARQQQQKDKILTPMELTSSWECELHPRGNVKYIKCQMMIHAIKKNTAAGVG